MEERATGTSSTQNKSTWKGKRPGRPVTHPRSPQLYQSWGMYNGWKPHLQKAPHYHSMSRKPVESSPTKHTYPAGAVLGRATA